MLLILEWEMLGTTSLTFSFAHLLSYWATLASFNNQVLGNWLGKFPICWTRQCNCCLQARDQVHCRSLWQLRIQLQPCWILWKENSRFYKFTKVALREIWLSLIKGCILLNMENWLVGRWFLKVNVMDQWYRECLKESGKEIVHSISLIEYIEHQWGQGVMLRLHALQGQLNFLSKTVWRGWEIPGCSLSLFM